MNYKLLIIIVISFIIVTIIGYFVDKYVINKKEEKTDSEKNTNKK